ncbi:hypothetical protein [Desulfonema magnum]|uniref:Uncharacterized protein n=1 Tax=Desulfonema magnum TaxID=45655 RepID=A0A975GN78_9BACT|nr:hypothetical protein [Desulfonema magnum]QTA87477.1 Uncharacterized protein dnm_035110 [Desulfonema magnum]
MLKDALNEMMLAYHELGRPIPGDNFVIEQFSVEERHVCQARPRYQFPSRYLI